MIHPRGISAAASCREVDWHTSQQNSFTIFANTLMDPYPLSWLVRSPSLRDSISFHNMLRRAPGVRAESL